MVDFSLGRLYCARSILVCRLFSLYVVLNDQVPNM